MDLIESMVSPIQPIFLIFGFLLILDEIRVQIAETNVISSEAEEKKSPSGSSSLKGTISPRAFLPESENRFTNEIRFSDVV